MRVVEAAKATRFIENAHTSPYRQSIPGGHRAAEVTVLPPNELVAAGFPVEKVRIFGQLERPTVQVIGGRGREWFHVYRWWWGLELCLWTPRPEEPEMLKWTPRDGWEQLFRIIQRHFVFEEATRRSHDARWVVEDAHGTPDDYFPGQYRPPTKQLLATARRWRSS